MSGHYDELALQEYLDDPESFEGRSELEMHLAVCRPCSGLLEELRTFEATLVSDALWSVPESGNEQPPGELRAIAELLAQEDAAAEQLLAPLLSSPASFRRANVTSLPEMRTAGVVRRLKTESRALRERQPMHALVLADAAIAISDLLPPRARSRSRRCRSIRWRWWTICGR